MSPYLQKQFDEAIADIKKYWFPDHQADFLYPLGPQDKGTPSLLTWYKPGTSTYKVHYIVLGNTLFVTGDIGSAIYVWNEPISFEWLATLDYHYFVGKNEGIEGKDKSYRSWDPKALAAHFDEEIKDLAENEELSTEEIIKNYGLQDWKDSVNSEGEWLAYLSDLYDRGPLDGEQLSDFHDLGLVPDMRTIGHWMGIQMAIQAQQ